MQSSTTSLILAMIRAELCNERLIYGLQQSGAVMQDLFTNLKRPIFDLAGFPQDDAALCDLYYQKIEECVQLPMEDFLRKDQLLAQSIYIALLETQRIQ